MEPSLRMPTKLGAMIQRGATCESVIMKVILDLCVVPVGVGTSVSSYVAACGKVLEDAGLSTVLHAYGTNIVGEWDEVFAAVAAFLAGLISILLSVVYRDEKIQTAFQGAVDYLALREDVNRLLIAHDGKNMHKRLKSVHDKYGELDSRYQKLIAAANIPSDAADRLALQQWPPS